MQLAANLALASVMVASTVMLHFAGLLWLMRVMERSGRRLRPHDSRAGQAALILFVVFGVFAAHTLEVWLYAALYLALGETRTLEAALYFSTVTFMSLGYGDIVLSPKWRVLSAIEAANGVVLVAWSTTFLFSVTQRLRLLDHAWLEPGAPER